MPPESGHAAASSASASVPHRVMRPPRIQTTAMPRTESTSRAIPAVTRKTPLPMIVPMTSETTAQKPRRRASSGAGGTAEAYSAAVPPRGPSGGLRGVALAGPLPDDDRKEHHDDSERERREPQLHEELADTGTDRSDAAAARRRDAEERRDPADNAPHRCQGRDGDETEGEPPSA